jgi:exodeoxyribonuclease VII small subunit
MKGKKQSDVVPEDIAKLKFEEAYAALKAATDRLEGDEIDLESTLAEYARASALAKHCARLLDSAEERIRVLVENEGEIQAKDLTR